MMNYSRHERITELIVNEEESIKSAMRAIDNGRLGIAFIVDADSKFIGLITDGDVRRATLRGVDIENRVKEIANTAPIVFRDEPTEEELLTLQNKEPIKTKKILLYLFDVF